MAITQAIVTTGTTRTLLNAVTSYLPQPNSPVDKTQYSWTTMTLVIQNVHATEAIYIGNVSVTTSAYGIKLAAGQSLSLDDLQPTEAIYAISAAASTLSVLSIVR